MYISRLKNFPSSLHSSMSIRPFSLRLFRNSSCSSRQIFQQPFRLARFWLWVASWHPSPLKSRLSKRFVRRCQEIQGITSLDRGHAGGAHGAFARHARMPHPSLSLPHAVCCINNLWPKGGACARALGRRRVRAGAVGGGPALGHSAAPRSRRRWRVSGRAAPRGSPDD